MKPSRPLCAPAHETREPQTRYGTEPAEAARQIRLGPLVVDVEQVGVGSARTGMPGLIRASAETGRAFLIRNTKNAAAATALLINPAVLEQRLLAARPRRTLGEVVDSLPFRRRGAPSLRIKLPDDDAPVLRVPGRAPAR